MGCSSSTAQPTDLKMDKPTDQNPDLESPPVASRPAEAFEIAFDDKSDGIIRKHPPKRLLRLEEQAINTPAPNIEELEEKLATAELRRQDYLNQKVSVAKQMRGEGSGGERAGKATEEEEQNGDA